MLRVFQIAEIHANLTWNAEHDETIHNNLLRRISWQNFVDCISEEKLVSPSQWLNLKLLGIQHTFIQIIHVYIYVYIDTHVMYIPHQNSEQPETHTHIYIYTNTNSYISSSFNLEISPKMADFSDLAMSWPGCGERPGRQRHRQWQLYLGGSTLICFQKFQWSVV